MRIHQDAKLSIAELDLNNPLELRLGDSRYGYVHIAFGRVRVGDTTLQAGDAIKFSGHMQLTFEALQDSQLLFFDLS